MTLYYSFRHFYRFSYLTVKKLTEIRFLHIWESQPVLKNFTGWSVFILFLNDNFLNDI